MTTTTLRKPKTNKYGTDMDAVAAAVFPGKSDEDTIELACGKCGGSGFISYYSYNEGGRCFSCEGTGGRHTVTVGSERKKACNRQTTADRNAVKYEKANAEAREEKKAQKAELEIWREANWNVVEFLAPHLNGFLGELSDQITVKPLTENQLAAVVKIMDEAANAGEVPVTDKRVKLAGEILSMKLVQDRYSYVESYTVKVVVKLDNGARVYGTAPKGFGRVDELKGSRVEFVARVEVSDDDKSFGFFSRPTKAVYVLAA